jgi:restriction endonuclease Mrr
MVAGLPRPAKFYVQTRRWQSTVGRPDLQALYDSLAGQKAKRGVFITTLGFLPKRSSSRDQSKDWY